MKNIKKLSVWYTLAILTTIVLFLILFPWEKTAKITYEMVPPEVSFDSIVQPIPFGKLSIMSPTQFNGYGYRSINTKTGKPGNYFYNSPIRCMTADICSGGKKIAGIFQHYTEGRVFGIMRIDLQCQNAVTMPQPWSSVQQPSWSSDGKFITFIIIDSTVSNVPQLGLWNIEKNTVAVCTKIDAAVYTPKWQPGTLRIGCIVKTNSGDGILSYNISTHLWDTLLAPTQKLSSMQITFNSRNTQAIFAGSWDGKKGLFSFDIYNCKVRSLFMGTCREPAVSFSTDTIACIATIDAKDWLVLIDSQSGTMKKVTPADSVFWPQWVWPDSVNQLRS